MFNSSSDLPQKSLLIKKDDKFFSWLLSKESSSMGSPSFRVYHGGVSGAVPFLWESQPGTPKHPSCESTHQTSLPPLTPPPSYYSTNTKQYTKQHFSSRYKFLNTSLWRIKYLKKASVPRTLSSSSSLSSSSGSSLHSSNSVAATAANFGRRNGFSRPRSRSFDDRLDDDDDHEEEESNIGSESTSTLCFGGSGLRRSYSVVIIKKAFLGIIGCKLN